MNFSEYLPSILTSPNYLKLSFEVIQRKINKKMPKINRKWMESSWWYRKITIKIRENIKRALVFHYIPWNTIKKEENLRKFFEYTR